LIAFEDLGDFGERLNVPLELIFRHEEQQDELDRLLVERIERARPKAQATSLTTGVRACGMAIPEPMPVERLVSRRQMASETASRDSRGIWLERMSCSMSSSMAVQRSVASSAAMMRLVSTICPRIGTE
jgi:hypothetical protein